MTMVIDPFRFGLGVEKDLAVVAWTGDGTSSRQIAGPDMSGGGVVLMFGTVSRGIVFSENGTTVRFKVAGTSPAPAVVTSLEMNSNGIELVTVGGDPNWNTNGELYLAVIASKDPDICNVVAYTGNAANRSIAHGLSSVPQFIVPVNFTTATANLVQQDLSLPGTLVYYVATSANLTAADLWNSTAADSANVYIGAGTGVNRVNTNGDQYYLIVFSDLVCKQLKYTGNGLTSGPTVNGFGYTPDLIYVKGPEATSARIVSSAINPGYTGNETEFVFGGGNSTANRVAAVTNGYQVVTDISDWNRSARSFLTYGFRPKP